MFACKIKVNQLTLKMKNPLLSYIYIFRLEKQVATVNGFEKRKLYYIVQRHSIIGWILCIND